MDHHTRSLIHPHRGGIGKLMHKGGVIRHQIHDVWNEDYYWLPWDESMEPAKKEEQEPRVYVSLDLSISRPFVRLLKVIPL